MKKFFFTALAALVLASCADLRENEFGRLDFKDSDESAPAAVKVASVRPISGGAVIKYIIPDDPRIKGVVAIYDRMGVEIRTKASRYVDSLTVVGFPDMDSRHVTLCSFSAAEVLSEGVDVTFTPLIPTIKTARTTVKPTFGGVQVYLEGNPSRDNLAVTILRCADLSQKDRPASKIEWEEVTTLFTQSDKIKMNRRGIDPVEAIFGVYVRNAWGVKTDTVMTVTTPLVEVELDKKMFSPYNPGDDTAYSANSSYYPTEALYDGSGYSGVPHFYVTDSSCPMPCWVTLDLGAVVQVDRIGTLPRIGYDIWKGGHVRDFEFWGSMAPTGKKGKGEHEFDDSWFCLGKFTQFKPSGYNQDGSVGECTAEDNTYFNNGNDFELNPDEYPHCYDNLRYFRIVFVNTFATFELGSKTGSVQFGEVTPYGLYVDNQ